MLIILRRKIFEDWELPFSVASGEYGILYAHL